METALSKPIAPGPGQGAKMKSQRNVAPVRPSQGRPPRGHCQTGTATQPMTKHTLKGSLQWYCPFSCSTARMTEHCCQALQ